MGAERAQGGRGWVRIPASRGEQPPARASATGASGTRAGGSGDQYTIYLSLLARWREAGRTLPGHPDEEWERLISQPCWPGR